MMKKYNKPQVDLVQFVKVDVLMVSGEVDPYGNDKKWISTTEV
jgi:hypothetical protein